MGHYSMKTELLDAISKNVKAQVGLDFKHRG